MKPFLRRSSLIYIAIMIAALVFFSFFFPMTKKPTEIPLSEVIAKSRSGEIEKIVVDGDVLLITTIDGTELKTITGNLTIVDLQELGLVLPEG
ncbi:unnamed protein product, partial [marine sediment metagenome]